VDTALLPDGLVFRFPSFSKVTPRYPSNHLQFISSFDDPLFYSVDTALLYDIFASTCLAVINKPFVTYHCFVRLLVCLRLLGRAVYCVQVFWSTAVFCNVSLVFISVVYEEIMQCSRFTLTT
jgi:hypothetical protein